jgi:hypothetical protein
MDGVPAAAGVGWLMADERSRFNVAITCPNCGQTGSVIWEDARDFGRMQGSQRNLIHISGGFHAEGGRTQSGDPLIVCNECDEIQDD